MKYILICVESVEELKISKYASYDEAFDKMISDICTYPGVKHFDEKHAWLEDFPCRWYIVDLNQISAGKETIV